MFSGPREKEQGVLVMEFQLLPPSKKTKNRVYTFVVNRQKYVLKVYRGFDRFARRGREKLLIEHWKHKGFKAPEICDMEIESAAEPYLVTKFIDGPSLRAYLPGTQPSEQLEAISRLFEQISNRHHIAIETDDEQLVQYDANTRNIICAQDGFYFVDFESFNRKHLSIAESASIEAATLCRWIVGDTGVEFLEEVVKIMARAYERDTGLLNLIVARTTARPFQFYSRWKNARRKRKNPAVATKYDVADTLARVIADIH
jgi:tRNA A-37 threonylcarbamoyl transferase component Bud32